MIIENIGGSASSLGFVGFAFADQNADSVKTLEVDAGDGCVAPDPETIASGEYPLSRDLYIYVNTAHAADNPAVVEFVDWFLSDGIGAVTEADYVALDDAALADTVSSLGRPLIRAKPDRGGRAWLDLPLSPMLSLCTRASVT